MTFGKDDPRVNQIFDVNADFDAVFAAVRAGIRSADPASVRPRDWQRVSLAVRDEEQRVIAGLYGATMWSWLLIEGLWVSTESRGQGLGRRLLLSAEEVAIERKCVGCWLGTFDFQAKSFYERHGYSVFSSLEGFPPGHSHFHMRKYFSRSPQQ